jgi:alkylhydroperoxidase family enzyme
VRFAGARAEGLDESAIDTIADGYEESVLSDAEIAALKLTDALIGPPRTLTDGEKRALRAHFDDAQVVEISVGVALFFALSKTLIGLGLEPESMPVSVLPTPGQVDSE